MLSYVSTESSDHSRLYCLARHTSQTSTLKTNTSHYQLQPQDQHFIPSSADLRPTRHTINYSLKTNTSHRLLQSQDQHVTTSTTVSRPTRHSISYSLKTNTSHRLLQSQDQHVTPSTTVSRPTRHTIISSLKTNTSHHQLQSPDQHVTPSWVPLVFTCLLPEPSSTMPVSMATRGQSCRVDASNLVWTVVAADNIINNIIINIE